MRVAHTAREVILAQLETIQRRLSDLEAKVASINTRVGDREDDWLNQPISNGAAPQPAAQAVNPAETRSSSVRRKRRYFGQAEMEFAVNRYHELRAKMPGATTYAIAKEIGRSLNRVTSTVYNLLLKFGAPRDASNNPRIQRMLETNRRRKAEKLAAKTASKASASAVGFGRPVKGAAYEDLLRKMQNQMKAAPAVNA